MIEYKGYLGVVSFDPEIDAFYGTVINTNDVIAFYGSSVTELKKEMQRSIEEYLAFCQEQGKKPEEPFSGKIVIQTSPELHRRMTLSAARRHLNLNGYIQEVLEKAVAAE